MRLPGLFNRDPSTWSADDQKAVVDVYKMLVDMADKISLRRQSANNFYLSVNTALIGASAYLTAVGLQARGHVWTIALSGAGICALWVQNIHSYRDLNDGKFEVIQALETKLPISPYTAEWNYLGHGRNVKVYRPFHTVERWVPYVFIGVHLLQVARLYWPF